jgi:hypothetical protein
MARIGEIELIASIDTGAYKKGASDISRANDEIAHGTEKSTSRAGQAWQTLGNVVVKSSAIAGAAVAAGFGLAVKETAKLEQSLGGAEVVFGEFSDTLKKNARDSAKVMGTSMNQYLETANKMGSLFQGAGFSVEKSMELTSNAMQRATDVATAMGISTDMALESIAGAAKGNFTMMDNLGVKMTATSIEAYALSKGIDKAFDSMTETEKAGFAMQQFMEVTAKYAGNYAKENQTLSGSFQTLKGAFGNFMSGVEGSDKVLVDSAMNMANVLGKQLPEIARRLVTGVSGVWREMKNSSPEFKKYADIAENTFDTITDGINTTIATIRALAPYLIGGATAWATYKTAVIAVNTVQKLQALYAAATATQYVLLNGVLVTVRTATIAQTIAQTALNTAMKLSPIGLVTAAIVGITAAYIASTAQTDRTKGATDRLNFARQQAKTATDNLKVSEDALKGAQLSAEGAALAVERAQLSYNEAVRQYGPKSLEAREAAYQLKTAQDSLAGSNAAVRDRTNEARQAQENLKAAKDSVIQANNAIAASAYGTADGYRSLTNRVAEAQEAMNKTSTRTGVSPIKSLIPSIGGRASGGPVRAGSPYFVGENPDGSLNKTSELFVPNSSGRIINSKDLQSALGNSGSSVEYNIGTITIASEVDGERWLRKLTGNQEIVSSGLVPQQAYM